MRDPHVVDLTYTLSSSPDVSFNNPPTVEFDTPIARFVLHDGIVTATMSEHFADLADARAAIEDTLRAWELRSAISSNVGRIRFVYKGNTTIDRAPPAAGKPQHLLVEGMDTLNVSDFAAVHLSAANYPDPPVDFVRTPEVEALCNRWVRQREGREPLLTCSYFILTVLERKFNGRREAARMLSVSESVLDQLGRLVSLHGDDAKARKAPLVPQPLTTQHEEWIQAVIPELIRRVAGLSLGPPARALTMADLPNLY